VGKRTGGRSAPTTVNSSVRTREYLTAAEIERLMAAARKSSRYGHRDATMILIGYRHGLRASELCDLQWSQVELATGRLHVRRATLWLTPATTRGRYRPGSAQKHPAHGALHRVGTASVQGLLALIDRRSRHRSHFTSISCILSG
jgi:integrase